MGLSGCLIDRGRIQNGKDSLIGEFGHMILDASDPERCGCGGRGCFERLVSSSRVRAEVEKRLKDYPDSMFRCISRDEMTVETVFELSARGDGLAALLQRTWPVFSLWLCATLRFSMTRISWCSREITRMPTRYSARSWAACSGNFSIIRKAGRLSFHLINARSKSLIYRALMCSCWIGCSAIHRCTNENNVERRPAGETRLEGVLK